MSGDWLLPHCRLELLIALTLGGKDIQYFEEEIGRCRSKLKHQEFFLSFEVSFIISLFFILSVGPFLVEWIPQMGHLVR